MPLNYIELFLSWLDNGSEMTQGPVSVFLQIVGMLVTCKKLVNDIHCRDSARGADFSDFQVRLRNVGIVTTPFGQQ